MMKVFALFLVLAVVIPASLQEDLPRLPERISLFGLSATCRTHTDCQSARCNVSTGRCCSAGNNAACRTAADCCDGTLTCRRNPFRMSTQRFCLPEDNDEIDMK